MAEATVTNAFAPLPLMDIQALESEQSGLDEDFDDGISAILTRRQRSRFAQIRLQLDGPMAFARPGLLAKLNVEEEQAETIHGIIAGAREAMVQNAQFPLTTRDVPRRDGVTPPPVGEATLET